MIYIPDALALVSVVAPLRELVWSLRGSSDGGYYLINLCLVGGSGGVANLKTVPIYQGVTDVFLRPSYATDSDGLTLLGIRRCGSVLVCDSILKRLTYSQTNRLRMA